jgi:DNA invertase Pin-like site-specific DNA recombinase
VVGTDFKSGAPLLRVASSSDHAACTVAVHATYPNSGRGRACRSPTRRTAPSQVRILPGRSTFGPSRRWRSSMLGPGRVMALPPRAVRAVLGFPDSPAPRVLPPLIVPESTRVYGFISLAFKSRDSNHENRLCAGQFEHAGLSGAGRRPECRRLLFSEKASGKSTNGRREFDKLMKALVPGDTVVVTRLDRLARSATCKISSTNFRSAPVASYRLARLGATPRPTVGRLVMTIMGGIGEFERSLIRSRCDEGIARAKRKGTKFGRPSALDAGQRRKIADRYAAGETMADLAIEYDCLGANDLASPPPFRSKRRMKPGQRVKP